MIDKLQGEKVFVRTVTHHYTGRLLSADERWLRLSDAAWIADDGRFADCLANGTPLEVEPFPDEVWIGVGAVLDVSLWTHALPREQKVNAAITQAGYAWSWSGSWSRSGS